jgi:adenylate cyclase
MSRLSKAAIMSFLIGTVGLLASLSPVGVGLEENFGLDLLFRLRGTREAPSDVMIVTMDKVSADNLNVSADAEDWPRTYHARLIENLVKRGAAVIAFDIIFDEPRNPQHDTRFAEAIRNARKVVLSESLKKELIPLTDERGAPKGDLNVETLVPPIFILARSAVGLAPFPLPKVPVKVSQYWTFKTGAGDIPTLPVVVFQIFALEVYGEFIRLLEGISPSQAEKLSPTKEAVINAKNIGNLVQGLRDFFTRKPLIAEEMLAELENSRTLVADVKKEQILKSLIRMYQSPDSHYLNFYGPPGTIVTIPYYQILRSTEKVPAVQSHLDVRGKAVFVGLSERMRPEQKDGFYTVFSQPNGIDISGVEIAATAFANLLEDMPVRPLRFGALCATILLWGMILGIVCRFFPTGIAGLSVLGMSVLYLITAHFQFRETGCWYPLIVPLFFQAPFGFFVTVLWEYRDTKKERQYVRRAFGYFLPDRVVDQLAKNMAEVKTSSQMVYGTCLSTDAEQYTTLSETMDPRELTSFMNRYYEVIFKPVTRYGGVVSDVKGDHMLAVWATANPDVALRNQACHAALEIARAVHRFKESSDTLHLSTRIGLHSGHMSLGTIGAVDHYEYRPVGDIVNTASRIEGLNKYLGTRVLASEEVLDQLDGFLTRAVGKFLLAGKSKPIVVFELLTRTEESNEQQRNLCALFTEGLNAHRRQSWEEAIEIFREVMTIHGEDGPAAFYLKVCEDYRENPPGEVWNDIVCLNNK